MRTGTPPLARFDFALGFAEVGCPTSAIAKFNLFCKEKFYRRMKMNRRQHQSRGVDGN
jgi:hypothetical protein